MASLQPLVVINAVGLTPRLAGLSPSLKALAADGVHALSGVTPAVTLPAQAAMLTGVSAGKHGVVGNGWYRRELGEVRFWVQANAQLQADPVYVTAARRAEARGQKFSAANLFWWFAQGAAVDWNLTPKPHYGADGSKAFGVLSVPSSLTDELAAQHGPFPFPSFWGPMAGVKSSRWIAATAATVITKQRPTLSLVYLPHLDYELQRKGPSGCGEDLLARLVGELAECVETVASAAKAIGAKILVVSEYGITDVKRAVTPNRELRRSGLLSVRAGPYGEMLDTTGSRAFAVCDHQVAHVYIANKHDIERTADLLRGVDGVASVLPRDEAAAIGLSHPNSGELILLSARDAWFAYPYWLDDALAPDFARTVDIHRKPGYDPCELFFDPALTAPKLRVARRLLARKLGFRNLMDVVPLDPSLVCGSHGLAAADAADGPCVFANERGLVNGPTQMTAVRDLVLKAMGLGE